jgi:16S rRNA processing protein RimM
MAEEGLLAIGKIQKAHGVRGELKVLSFSGSSELFYSIDEVIIGKERKSAKPFRIINVKGGKRTSIVELEGVDLNKAREMVGQIVWVQREKLPPLQEDEYYWADLIGMEVHLKDGRPLGSIKGIMNFGSSDIYVCEDHKREILIPAVKGIIHRIDLEKKIVIVEEVEGLI